MVGVYKYFYPIKHRLKETKRNKKDVSVVLMLCFNAVTRINFS